MNDSKWYTSFKFLGPPLTTAGELIRNGLEWAASLLDDSVANLTNKVVREFVNEWLESPFCYHYVDLHDYKITITMEHTPRFNMYGNEFGLGKLVAVRIGPGNCLCQLPLRVWDVA
ncbi:hypothetical protein RDABS01_027569, partial [Bienertia sinuspersici]